MFLTVYCVLSVHQECDYRPKQESQRHPHCPNGVQRSAIKLLQRNHCVNQLSQPTLPNAPTLLDPQQQCSPWE